MGSNPTPNTFNADGSMNVSGGGAGGATAANQTAVQTPVAPATATATKGSLGGNQYNATPPSPTDGQQLSTQADSKGSTKVSVCGSDGLPVSMTAAVLVYQSNSFLNVAAGTATTTVKSGAGTFASVTINTKGASSNTLTIYDNTAASGTKIATIDTTVAAVTLYFNIAFATGLTLASATGTGADYTVAYL